jgi:hypothetical protein
VSHDDAVRARFGATPKGVPRTRSEQIEEVREQLGRSSRPCAATSARSTRAPARARSRSRWRRWSGEVVGVDLVPELPRGRAPRTRRRTQRSSTAIDRLAVREVYVRPRLSRAGRSTT